MSKLFINHKRQAICIINLKNGVRKQFDSPETIWLLFLVHIESACMFSLGVLFLIDSILKIKHLRLLGHCLRIWKFLIMSSGKLCSVLWQLNLSLGIWFVVDLRWLESINSDFTQNGQNITWMHWFLRCSASVSEQIPNIVPFLLLSWKHTGMHDNVLRVSGVLCRPPNQAFWSTSFPRSSLHHEKVPWLQLVTCPCIQIKSP